MNLTLEELAAACGLPTAGVKELERFGLISSRDVGGTGYYDEEALAIANLAAGFARHGVEARHLRMYKNGAERESGLFEQVVMPLIKQRNPDARQQAAATLEELARLGGELRAALLRHSLRDAF
jgi:DNA-binding transcriptional MerR regulator